MKESQKAEMEKLMADLAGAIQGHNPKSFAALNKSANGKMMGKAASKRSAEDAARVAQELIYDAWEEGNKNKRISLAKKALSIFPDCADAYKLLIKDKTLKTP